MINTDKDDTDTGKKPDYCSLCQRRVALTFHHLIPRKMHRRTFFRKHYKKTELQRGIFVCRACHNGIHRLYDEMALAKRLNSLEALRKDEALSRHCQWVAKQKVSY